MTDSRYKPIADYAAIGNLRTVALVGRDTAIDWCCFPNMDSPSVFAAILDADKGGSFRVRPSGRTYGDQSYLKDTNVVRTSFEGDGGRVTVTDFLPLRGEIHGCAASEAPPEIHRLIRCEGGEMEVEVEWAPRFDYARASMKLHEVEGGWLAEDEKGEHKLVLAGLRRGEGAITEGEHGPVLRARLGMKGDETRVLVARWENADTSCSVEETHRLLEQTCTTWRDWLHNSGRDHDRAWAGTWEPLLIRSELALKLVTHADTGAIAAAPTTSLPETIGGVRNWDYRYTWIRDASLTAQALISLNHTEDAIEFLMWSERAAEKSGEDRVQIMYGLHGESDLEEIELTHLEGYRGSAPVRIGNGAAKQLQLDVYGELLDSAYELLRRGIELEPEMMKFLTGLADRAAKDWEQPDYGIWEVRSEPRHFTYSKLMTWVALDRAILLAEQFGLQGDVSVWKRERERLRSSILEKGYDSKVGSFVQSYGSEQLDASSLHVPLYELLPFDDERAQNTIDRTIEELMESGMVYRYRGDDGLPGEEGTFGLCTFWLVDCLALSTRLDEAWSIFEGMAGRANHVGLLPEQIDAKSGEFLGNFPQAFSHIGLINSLLYLGYAEGREIPDPSPVGTPSHRRGTGHRSKKQ
ncbi:glycoside hydrolase family 15 protein [soil metagenome]